MNDSCLDKSLDDRLVVRSNHYDDRLLYSGERLYRLPNR